MSKYYAVRVGHRPGIYESWSQVQPLVSGFRGAEHKSFKSLEEARVYLASGSAPLTGKKRAREEDIDIWTTGAEDSYRYNADRRNGAVPAQRTGGFPDSHYNPPATSHQKATIGLIIAEPRAPPPKPAYSPPHRSGGNNGGGRSRFDPVIEGPYKHVLPTSVYELEFDGASRGNPGQAGCGAVLRHNGDVVCRLRKYMGSPHTNNEAEYTALIEGLMMARRAGVTRVHAKGDSKLVVKQVSGEWAINKPHLQALCDKVEAEKRNFSEFKIHHIRREWNADADKLSNDAIDLAR